MINVVFITGPTGAGKTTYLNNYKSQGYEILSTGEIFRKHFANSCAGNSNNMVAPDFADKLIINTIVDKIMEVVEHNGVGVAIETFPRKLDQIKQLKHFKNAIEDFHCQDNISFSVVMIMATRDTCYKRAISRDEANHDESRKKLDMSKLELEFGTNYWGDMKSELVKTGIDFRIINNE